MRWRWRWLWTLACGCGRIGFDLAGPGDLGGDASIDDSATLRDGASGIGIVDEIADSLDELIAYEPSEPLLREFALDRVCSALEHAGVDLGELDHDAARRLAAERLAPDRARIAIDEAIREWRARKTAAIAAYRDVAAGRCVLLQWEAKNPAL